MQPSPPPEDDGATIELLLTDLKDGKSRQEPRLVTCANRNL